MRQAVNLDISELHLIDLTNSSTLPVGTSLTEAPKTGHVCNVTKFPSLWRQEGRWPPKSSWIQSFNSRLRDACLAVEELNSLLEAPIVIGNWRRDYGEHRPHSALAMLTPTAFATRQPQSALS